MWAFFCLSVNDGPTAPCSVWNLVVGSKQTMAKKHNSTYYYIILPSPTTKINTKHLKNLIINQIKHTETKDRGVIGSSFNPSVGLCSSCTHIHHVWASTEEYKAWIWVNYHYGWWWWWSGMNKCEDWWLGMEIESWVVEESLLLGHSSKKSWVTFWGSSFSHSSILKVIWLLLWFEGWNWSGALILIPSKWLTEEAPIPSCQPSHSFTP